MRFLAWCLLLHFVSDFVMQSRWIAENKSTDWRALGTHMGHIWLVFLVGTFSLPLASSYALIHGLQDRFIWRGYKWLRRNEQVTTFQYWKDDLFWQTVGLDQLLHALTLIGLASWLGLGK